MPLLYYDLAINDELHGARTHDQESLIDADHLYNMVIKLLAENYTLRIRVLARLASIKNLAQIQFESEKFASATAGCRPESCDALSARERQGNGFFPTFFQEPQIKGLLLNVFVTAGSQSYSSSVRAVTANKTDVPPNDFFQEYHLVHPGSYLDPLAKLFTYWIESYS